MGKQYQARIQVRCAECGDTYYVNALRAQEEIRMHLKMCKASRRTRVRA